MTAKPSGQAIIRWIATPPAMTASYEATLLKYTENILSISSGIQDLCHCYGIVMLLQTITISILINELDQGSFSSFEAWKCLFLHN